MKLKFRDKKDDMGENGVTIKKYNFLITFFSWTKNNILSNKRFMIFLSTTFLSVFGCSTTSMLFSSFLKNNQSITLREIAINYSKENNEEPNGLIYYNQTINSYYETVYRKPEITREMSEIFYKNTFIDLYVSNWNNLYSPGVVEYSNGETINLSFLMFPKQNYIDQAWKYKMPLLYPANTTPLSRLSLPNEIYINTEYAEKLLIDFGFSSNEYDKLYDKTITIPFSWNYIKAVERKPDLIDVSYVIKGVIDSNSEEYNYYQNMFGDFFIASEYFTLPIPSQTYFDLPDHSTNEKLFSTILDRYHYQTKKSNNLSGASDYVFQTRISFFGNKDTDCSIESIWKQSNKYTMRSNKCFEAFTASNTLYIIIFLIVNLCSTFLLLFSAYKIKMEYHMLADKNFVALVFWILVCLGLGLVFGLILKNILFSFVNPIKYLSGNNYIGSIIYLAEILLFNTIFFLVRQRKKTFKENKQ